MRGKCTCGHSNCICVFVSDFLLLSQSFLVLPADAFFLSSQGFCDLDTNLGKIYFACAAGVFGGRYFLQRLSANITIITIIIIIILSDEAISQGGGSQNSCMVAWGLSFSFQVGVIYLKVQDGSEGDFLKKFLKN